MTTWLVGGEFHVLRVASDGQALTIDYVLPLGQLEPFPENPQPPLDPGRLANIDHIVVLMMENRSFDHMLGYLSKHGGRARYRWVARRREESLQGAATTFLSRCLARCFCKVPATNTSVSQIR